MTRAWPILAAILVLAACAEEFHGRPPVTEAVHYPVATAVDEDAGLLYVVNSNFDLAYRAASIVTVDLATNQYREPYLTLGSFPGEFVLTRLSGSEHRAGYLAVRGDDSLTWFRAEGSAPVRLICSDDDESHACSGDHKVTDGLLADDEEEALAEVDLGSDPYALAFVPGSEGEPDHLVLSAMKDGTLSLFDVDETGFPTLVDQRLLATGSHSAGVDPATGVVHITNKTYPLIYRFKVRHEDGISSLEKLTGITVPSPYSTSQYGRGIGFADGGAQILLTYRTPASLLVVAGGDAYGDSSQTTLKAIPLGSKPGHLLTAATGPEGQEVAYVPCYGDDTVWAVDLESYEPLAVIPVGSGPYHMSVVANETMRRGYVVNFLSHTVSVIDLDPSSPYYHTQIAEIH